MIVHSSWERDSYAQKDGRVGITDTHVDHLGREHSSAGLFPAGYDLGPEIPIRAKIIDDSLKAAEIEAALGEMTAKIQPAPTKLTQADPAVAAKLKYATAQELDAAVAATPASAEAEVNP